MFFLYITLVLFTLQGANSQLFGPGCLNISFTPPSGSQLPNSVFQLHISFSAPTGFISAGVVTPLSQWTNGSLLNLWHSYSFLYLQNTQNKTEILAPNSFSPLSDTDLNATFSYGTLISTAWNLHFLSIAIPLAAPSIGLPTQSWPVYGSQGYVPSIVPPPPNPYTCPVAIPQISPQIIPPSPQVTSNLYCTDSACQLLFNASLPSGSFDSLIDTSTFVGLDGNTYTLSSTPILSGSVSAAAHLFPLGNPSFITPVFEALADINPISSPMYKEIPEAMAQSWFNLVVFGVPAGPGKCNLWFPLESRYYSPATDSLNATVIRMAGSSYLGQFQCNSGVTINLLCYEESPRPVFSWFIDFVANDSGLTCPQYSARNIYCPDCNVTHYWANVLSDAWSYLSIMTPQLSPAVPSLSLYNQTCNFGNPLCSVSYSIPSLPSTTPLVGRKLVTPDVRVTPPSAQNSSYWLLPPSSAFWSGSGTSINTLDVDNVDFVEQMPFCTNNMNAGLVNQLGNFLNDPQQYLVNKLAQNESSTTYDAFSLTMIMNSSEYFMELSYYGAYSQVNFSGTVDLTSQSISILQPTLILQAPFTTNYLSPTQVSVSVNISNTGQLLASPVSLDILCTPPVSVSPYSCSISPNATSSMETTLSIQSGTMQTYTCSPEVTTATLPYWELFGKTVSLSSFSFSTDANGCLYTSYQNTSLFVSPSSWTLGLASAELGTNPFGLSFSSPVWISAVNIASTLQGSVQTQGSSNSTVSITVICVDLWETEVFNSSLDLFEVIPGLSYVWNLDIVASPVSGSTYINCSIQARILTGQCITGVGTYVDQEVSLPFPASPCTDLVNLTEPSLFQSIEAWSLLNSSQPVLPTQFAVIAQQGWKQDTVILPSNATTSFINSISYILTNGGSGAGYFIVFTACNSQFISPVPSLTSQPCFLAPNGSCTYNVTLGLLQSSIPPQPMLCAAVAQIVRSNESVCWSSFGKIYVQQFQIGAGTNSQSPSLSPTFPTSSGLSRSAIIAIFVTLGVLTAAALIVLLVLAIRLFRRHPVEPMMHETARPASDPVETTNSYPQTQPTIDEQFRGEEEHGYSPGNPFEDDNWAAGQVKDSYLVP